MLFIDADNFAVRDPTALFHSREFNVTGALLWQDFWAASTAPEVNSCLSRWCLFLAHVVSCHSVLICDQAAAGPGAARDREGSCSRRTYALRWCS